MEIVKLKEISKIKLNDESYYLVLDEQNNDYDISFLNNFEFMDKYEMLFIKNGFFNTNEKLFQLLPIIKGKLLKKITDSKNIWDLNLKLFKNNNKFLYIYNNQKINYSAEQLWNIEESLIKSKFQNHSYISRILCHLNVENDAGANFNLMITFYEPELYEIDYWVDKIKEISKEAWWKGITYVVNDSPINSNKISKSFENIGNVEIFSSIKNVKRFQKMISVFNYLKWIKGNHIKICDPDDFISVNLLENFIFKFDSWSSNDYDLIVNKAAKITQPKSFFLNMEESEIFKKGENKKFNSTFGNFQIIYIADKFEEFELDKKFKNKIKFHDDRMTSSLFAGRDKKILYIDDGFYVQFHKNGISNTFSKKFKKQELKDLREIYNFLIDNNYGICKFNISMVENDKKLMRKINAYKNKTFSNIWDMVEKNGK